MFALCSSLAPRLAAKFGMEKLMALVLLVMVLGSGMRVLNLPALYIGTMLVGLQLRLLMFCYQVWLRLIFKENWSVYDDLYHSHGVAATVASMIAVPIVSSSSWEFLFY